MNVDVFMNPHYIPLLDDMSRVQILFGGAGSGKSFFKAQQVVLDLMAGGRNYLICRQVARTIRKSVFTEVRKQIKAMKLSNYFSSNKAEGTITCKVNGYQAMFVGLDDVEKVKSITPEIGVITDVWIEEATEVDRDTVRQLKLRQRGGDPKTKKRLCMTFNPILQSHWIYEDYFSNIGWTTNQTEHYAPGLSIHKTWFIHNQTLTQDDIDALLAETDDYTLQVYTYGNWGMLGDVIFNNWKVEDLSGMHNQFVNKRNGCDFGFSKDPAAVGVSHYDKKHKTIYFYNEMYQTGLTNDKLADEIKEMIGNWKTVYKREKQGDKEVEVAERVCDGTERIACDSAEPKSIAELKQYGVNAYGVLKGKDSINHGIDWLKQQTIVVDKSCVNLIRELQQYHWKKDANGNVLKVPVDKYNHLIDGGLRYAYEDDMREMDSSKLVDFAE